MDGSFKYKDHAISRLGLFGLSFKNILQRKRLMRKFLKLFLILFFIGFSLPFSIAFTRITADVDYPDYSGYVNDYVGFLDAGTRDRIESMIAELESATGAEIAVAIVPTLSGITEEEYALGLFEKWKIGKEGIDNGVLLLICTEGLPGQRPLRIEVGYGLEGAITDLEAGRILNDVIIPFFNEGALDDGVYYGVSAIAQEIYEEYGLETGSAQVEPASVSDPKIALLVSFGILVGAIFIFFMPFLIIAGIIIAVLLRISVSRRCPRCKKLTLKRTNRILAAATYQNTGKKLIIRECRNCGFRDEKEYVIPVKKAYSHRHGGSGGSFGGFSGGSGGFGGFGGGSSGGGGASGKW